LGYNEGLLYFQSINDTKLEPEKIKDMDIGYVGIFRDIGLSIDFKIFRSLLSKLISERIDYLKLGSLTNNGKATLYGAELQVDYSPSHRTKTGLSYSYIKSDANDFYEETLYSKHKGSLYVTQSLSPTLDMSLMYVGSSTMNASPYGRIDFVTHKDLSFGSDSVRVEFKASHHLHEQKYSVNPTFEVDNKYDSQTHYFVSFMLDI
jgi:outer membrane receptor protein involved in Fe transport